MTSSFSYLVINVIYQEDGSYWREGLHVEPWISGEEVGVTCLKPMKKGMWQLARQEVTKNKMTQLS